MPYTLPSTCSSGALRALSPNPFPIPADSPLPDLLYTHSCTDIEQLLHLASVEWLSAWGNRHSQTGSREGGGGVNVKFKGIALSPVPKTATGM